LVRCAKKNPATLVSTPIVLKNFSNENEWKRTKNLVVAKRFLAVFVLQNFVRMFQVFVKFIAGRQNVDKMTKNVNFI
jgi:hypothetical protein